MIDFPILELLDDRSCLIWLERHRHPTGFTSPHCHSLERRLFRQQGAFPAYRCRRCDGTIRFCPATLLLLLRGIAKGKPTACRAHELGLSRTPLHTLRQRIQANLNNTAPTGVMAGTACEVDELYQNAGE